MRGSKVKDIFATISKSIFSKKKSLYGFLGFFVVVLFGEVLASSSSCCVLFLKEYRF